ncbi:MAG: glycosyltransferase family 39 protein, partial [Acidobacteriota bacterium]
MDDELRYWRMALSFWETGTFLYHGRPFDIPSILYPILLSPLFAIRDLTLVFDLARLVNGFLLSAVLFPTYALAREFTDSRTALFPAVLAGLVPGAVYSSLVMAENLYYPLFCLSFWLAYRTLMRANWRDAALASLAFFATFFTKPNLVFLAVAYGAALAVTILQRFRRRAREQGVGLGLLPRLAPFAGLGAAAAVRLALRGGLHPGQSWKGVVGGDAYALVFDPGGGVPSPLRIAGLAIGLLLTLFLSVGFVPAGRFLGAATRFRALSDRLRTYLIFCFALGLVSLAAVIQLSVFDSQPRMQERYLFVLAPMVLVLLSANGSSQRGISFLTTAALWLVFTMALATCYPRILNWNLQSDSPSLTAFFYVSRRAPGVVPLILSAVVVGAFVLASMLSRRVWAAFGSLGLLFVLLNAGWYANVYGIDKELRFFKRFALNVGTRARPG